MIIDTKWIMVTDDHGYSRSSMPSGSWSLMIIDDPRSSAQMIMDRQQAVDRRSSIRIPQGVSGSPETIMAPVDDLRNPTPRYRLQLPGALVVFYVLGPVVPRGILAGSEVPGPGGPRPPVA